MGNASIYKFKKSGNYIIHSLSIMDMGASIATKPFIKLEASTSMEEIAKQLLYAMSCSKINIPRPKDWDEASKEFLQSMGFKNNRSLHEEAINVGVYRKDNFIEFNPTINLGAKDGFRNISNEKIELAADKSIEEIAQALKVSFEKCE